MRKPIILHVLPWSLFLGGPQRFVADLANHFKKFTAVHVLHLGNKNPWKELMPGVKFHEATNVKHAAQILQTINPDLVHHHYPAGKWLLKEAMRFPIIGTNHTWKENNSPQPPWAIPICGRFPGVVKLGVNTGIFCPAKKQDQKTFVVGIVGRIDSNKLPEGFIRALEKWAAPANVVVRIVGGGFQTKQARKTVDRLGAIPSVKIIGKVSPEKMAAEYQTMDLLLIPSLRDSTSYVALEAMACGVPILARSVQGLPDTVGNAGILLDISVDQDYLFFRAVSSLMENQKRFAAFQVKARERMVNFYSLDAMLKKYEGLYSARGVKR